MSDPVWVTVTRLGYFGRFWLQIFLQKSVYFWWKWLIFIQKYGHTRKHVQACTVSDAYSVDIYVPVQNSIYMFNSFYA